MVKKTLKHTLSLLTLALLAACGDPGGVPVGNLQVSIDALPAGASAVVQVTGPNGYARTLSQSQTLANLVEGSYSVSAQPITVGGTTYTPSVSGSPAQVRAGATASVTVIYPPPVNTGPGGSISGTVSIAGADSVPFQAEAPFVPGEAIVKFRPGLRAQGALEVAGMRLSPVRALGLGGVQLYRAAARTEEGTLELIRGLRARPEVLYAHPNYLLEPFAEPNDPLYAAQWHYGAINLPEAWDLTTGDAEVTVAVLDTGILPAHPDLQGQLLPGYDFVKDIQFSGDGDGRDGDPTDPGGDSGYHGSHVAGTVAAATNNGVGVAGVSWGSKVLPVRLLGPGGGNVADAIDAILWSVGSAVEGVPENSNPAQVLNMSLGNPFLCSGVPGLQEALDQAAAAGAVVVVAAGNSNTDASSFAPANCGGVIAVGATDFNGNRAPYSNYGARIDVMAPGGDVTQDADANSEPDGVLSTIADGAGAYTYGYLQGTSMASPHVAGVVALMKSLRPELTGPEARDILARTARPIDDPSCDVGCGAGLIDARAALEALEAPITPDFTLSLSPATISLVPGGSATVGVQIGRLGGFDAEVALSVVGAPAGLSASFSPVSTAGGSSTLTLSADATLEGSYTLQIQGTGGGVTKAVLLSLVVESDAGVDADVSGAVVFACPVTASRCVLSQLPAVEITESGSSAPYEIPNVPAGSYHVGAWRDDNGNGVVDEGEPVGGYTVANELGVVNPPASGIDLTMTPSLGTPTFGSLPRKLLQLSTP